MRRYWPTAIAMSIPWLLIGAGYWIAGIRGALVGVLMMFGTVAFLTLAGRWLHDETDRWRPPG